MERAPLSARHVLLAVRPGGRTCSPKVSRPFDGVPRASPVRGGSSLPPRFRSQVFSTSQRFPGRLELSGLVSCRNHPWAWPSPRSAPSELSPRKNRAPLSGSPAPLRSSARVRRRRSPGRSPRVSPTAPTRASARRPAWFPARLWAPFPRAPWLRRAPRTRFPVTLGPTSGVAPFRGVHPLRSLVPPANPFTTDRVAPGPPVAALLEFVPSEAFSAHTWDPRTRPRGEASRTPPCHPLAGAARRAAPRTCGRETACPRARWTRASDTEESLAGPVDGFQLAVAGWPGPPLGGLPPPVALDRSPDLRSLAGCGKPLLLTERVGEAPAPLGFLAFSPTS